MAGWPAALLWDVDGTLAETELEGHRLAFNCAFAEAGLPWQWEPAAYLELLRISGGRERIRQFLIEAEGLEPDPERVEKLQAAKQRHYRALLAAGALQLRPGVERLLRDAAAEGVRQVIVTTSGRSAVEGLLERLLPDHPNLLEFWVCGEDVPRKKPDPAAYQQALAQLGLPAAAVLAVEDSGNGVAAAVGAGLRVLVTRSGSSAAESDQVFAAATAELDQLGEPGRPCVVQRGPACPEGWVTLSYLQQLGFAA
jgi:HAD superfamily hydrolase (TIGR01509 family)